MPKRPSAPTNLIRLDAERRRRRAKREPPPPQRCPTCGGEVDEHGISSTAFGVELGQEEDGDLGLGPPFGEDDDIPF